MICLSRHLALPAALALSLAPPASSQSAFWSQYNGAGKAAFAAEQYAEAEQAWTKALAECEKLPSGDPRRGLTVINLSHVYGKQKREAQCEALLKNALASNLLAANDASEVATALCLLLQQSGKTAEAQETAKKYGVSLSSPDPAPAASNKEAATTSGEDYTSDSGWGHGLQRYRDTYTVGDYAAAEVIADAMLKCIDQGQHSQSDLAAALDNLIRACYALNKFEKAEPLYNRYLMMLNRTAGPESQAMASGLKNYASLCRRIGQNELAVSAESRARAIAAKLERQSSAPAKTEWLTHNNQGSAAVPAAARTTTTGTTTAPEGDSVTELSEDEFVSLIASGSSQPIFVDFYATWCRPCRKMMPVVASLSSKYGSRMSFCRVDVDKAKNISNTYQISSIPTFIIFKNGTPAFSITGGVSEETLAQGIEEQLK